MVDNGPPGRASKKVSPLAYIIVVIVVVLIGIAVFGPNRTLTTPSGGEVDASVPAGSDATTTGGAAAPAPASANP